MKWQTYLIILTLTIFCKKNTKLNKYNKLLWVYNILKKALLYSFIFKKIKRRIYMRKVSKILALVLVAVLVMSVFTACSEEKKTATKGSYTYWAVPNSSVTQTLNSYDELLMYQEMQKRTGIEVKFLHPGKGSTGGEAFQILMTSTDMPDMIEYNWESYPGGPDAAIENKVIISLNDYMKEAAPNYYSYMEGEKAKDNPLYKIQTITNAGNYYGFNNLTIGQYRCFAGLVVRKDLLDKWGLEVPVTIDDWTNVLKTAKENGIAKPLTGQNSLFGIDSEPIFGNAWEVSKEFQVEDDKVVFSVERPEYKEYIRQMAEWYKAGYIDRDYITNESNVVDGNMTNGTSVACFGYIGGFMGSIIPAMAERDPNFNIVACPYPVLKEGQITKIQSVATDATEPTIAVTYNCGKDNEERYKEAMSWCDYLYSDEGIILKSFGVEGETYTVEKDENGNDHYVYTDTIYDHEKIGAHSVGAALYHFFRPANSPGFSQHDDYLNGYYPYQQQKDALAMWNEHIEISKKYILPELTYTDDEAARVNELNSKCRDKLDAEISKIICNEKPLSSFDSMVKDAKKNGYDELTKLHQAAYDRTYK